MAEGLDIPVLTGSFDRAADFSSIERLRQYVPRTQIQGFRPKPVVGEPRCNNQGRGVCAFLHVFEQVTPVARHQVVLTNNHAHLALAQEAASARQIDGPRQFALAGSGTRFQELVIRVKWANRQYDHSCDLIAP